MPTPGYVFKGSGLTPDDEISEEKALQKQESTPNSPSKPPAGSKVPASRTEGPLSKNSSGSHALAVAEHEVTGAAQAAGHLDEFTDLGWKDRSRQDVENLVGSLPNEDLWTLIRRFNKVHAHLIFCNIDMTELTYHSKCIMSKHSRKHRQVVLT